MSGPSRATGRRAIRTGSWLAPEARPETRRPRGSRLAWSLWRVTLAPLDAVRRVMGVRTSLRIPAAVATCHTLRLESPLQLNGGQYAPVAWSADRRLERRRPSSPPITRFVKSCSADMQAQRNAAAPIRGARHLAVRALPDRRGLELSDGLQGRAFFEDNFKPVRISRLGEGEGFVHRLLRAHRRWFADTTSLQRAGLSPAVAICSYAAPRRARPDCPTRARCFARSAAASWCPITTAARSRTARSPASGLEIC